MTERERYENRFPVPEYIFWDDDLESYQIKASPEMKFSDYALLMGKLLVYSAQFNAWNSAIYIDGDGQND